MVTDLLKSGGEDVLPIILMNSEVRSTGSYPSRTDLGAWAGQVSELKAPTPANTVIPGSVAESSAAESSCCGDETQGAAQPVQIGAAPTATSCC